MARRHSKRQTKSHSRRSRHSRRHRGGSQASNLVMSFAPSSGLVQPVGETTKLSGHPANLNLYQTTGGARRRVKRGGSPASDWVMQRAQYTLDEMNKLGAQNGGRRSKKSRRHHKSKKHSRRSKKVGGGATDIRDTLYSRIYNGDRTDAVPFFNAFTNEQYISQQDLANEPNMVANPPYLR